MQLTNSFNLFINFLFNLNIFFFLLFICQFIQLIFSVLTFAFIFIIYFSFSLSYQLANYEYIFLVYQKRENKISDDGVSNLCNSLAEITNLISLTLNLSSNNTSFIGAQNLLLGLRKTNISTLRLYQGVNEKEKEILIELGKRSKSKLVLFQLN
ncbi:transmembrane protein, putative (macronuclear) [Tetrahymena thermophila SB210]|uniref:Transmembrane protein, putative n=1 Tax=Tetrahymena thermophila (strain SB210) TaxID=312017 RepID=W7X7X6_TETTS|nr:transmembrane protein, putative [Tetrahymena thermophila SB210]EWS72528.1 transmembrane protein, putative [Tetrahymena thermophila SB210]|eukprot:XP_012654930.1 transmembrane protein, putative [Tetrahymena thermophila SB210]